jgi:flagellar motor switch protein FliM
MMGGSSVLGRSFPDRPLSEIENTLLRSFLERQLPELRSAFAPIGDITPRVIGIESSPQFAQVAGPSDPVVHVKFKLQIDAVETTVAMCTPWSSMALVLEDVLNKGTLTTVQFDKATVKKRLTAAANEVKVSVSARFEPCAMTADEIFSLEVGDVVRLGAGLDAPLTLFTENQATHRVKPGRSGRKVAVEVLDTMLLGKPQDSDTGGRR